MTSGSTTSELADVRGSSATGPPTNPTPIDWKLAFDVAGELAEAAPRLATLVAEVDSAAPVFRNRSYPLSPLPLFIRQAAVASLTPDLEAYVELLNLVVRLYREDPAVRRWYGLGHAAEAIIAAEGERAADGGDVAVCRLDGYLQQGSERLHLLENNADAPAGTLFTPRIHGVVAALHQRLGITSPAHDPATVPTEQALLDVLLARLGSHAASTTPSLAVLQPAGRENRESVEMAAAYRELGVDMIVADPHELTAVRGDAEARGRRIDACWNKINTVAWRRMLQDDSDLLQRWIALLRDTDVVHVNSFAARYVAESKLTLAFVQDPAFAGNLDEGQRQLVNRLLPRTVLVTPDPRWRNTGDSLVDALLEEPWRYVLKEPYDIRGDGVTVGRTVPRATWVQAVKRAAKEPMIVQDYVAPTAYPTLRPTGQPWIVVMPISLDTYVLEGRVAFLGSKASLAPRVNVFQGGQKVAVHVSTQREVAR